MTYLLYGAGSIAGTPREIAENPPDRADEEVMIA